MSESDYLIAEFGGEATPSSVIFSSSHSESEQVVCEYYQQQDYEVVGLDSGVESGNLRSDISLPESLQERLRKALDQNHDLTTPLERKYPLSFIQNSPGVPDFLVYSPSEWEDGQEYSFVEVKTVGTGLNKNQLHWIANLSHFPYKITYVSELAEETE